MFNYEVRGIGLAAIVTAVFWIYFPIVFTAYAIDMEFLHHGRRPDLKQLRDMLIIGAGIYALLFTAKGFLLYCMHRGYLVWMLVFLPCIAFTSIIPGIVVYHAIDDYMSRGYALAVSFVAGYILYLPYRFLSDTNAGLARPFYHLGIDLAHTMYRLIERRKESSYDE